MQLVVLEFTPIMHDIQTTLNTMNNMAVNHVQITQALCAGFPVKTSAFAELDVLIGQVPMYLCQRDIEKIHLCGEFIFNFLVEQLQPYNGQSLLRYGCPGFFHTQGYVIAAQYHDASFFKEFVKIQNNLTTSQRPVNTLIQLEDSVDHIEQRIAKLSDVQNCLALTQCQNYLDHQVDQIARIRTKQ